MIPEWGRSLGKGGKGINNGSPLQDSCLANPMDGGAWWAAVHGVAKSRTRLSNFPFTFHRGAGTLIPSAQRLVWAAKQPLWNAALGALFACESEVSQSCPTLSDPVDCSPPGSSVHGIFQARALEWGVLELRRPWGFLARHARISGSLSCGAREVRSPCACPVL